MTSSHENRRLTDERVLEMLRQMGWVRDNASGWSFDSDEILDFVSLLEEVTDARKLVTSSQLQERLDTFVRFVAENKELRKRLADAEQELGRFREALQRIDGTVFHPSCGPSLSRGETIDEIRAIAREAWNR